MKHEGLVEEIFTILGSAIGDIDEDDDNEEYLDEELDQAIEKYINNYWKEKEIAMEIISRDYDYLKGRDQKLSALEEYGVDNWEGYEEAMRSMK